MDHPGVYQFDLDLVINVLSKTLFSPFFCVFLPLPLLSQTQSTIHPAFIVSCIWTGIICVFGVLKHINRIYASRGSWIFAPPKLAWDRQIVLITGGGTGIGALLAEALAMRNVSVVVLSKHTPQYETENENIVTYICDVSNYDQVQATALKVCNEVGNPTIIVNNAGVVKGKLLLDLTKEDVNESFGVNTLASFWILQAFLPAMIHAGTGHIVSMSSILGLVGAAQMTDYCASKAALVSLHQTLRFELDNRYRTPSIRTTLVLPSFTLTKLFSRTKLPTSPIFNFFAPPIHPHVIVKAVIDGLDAHESRIIRVPWYSNFARFMGPGVGIVPKWLGDMMQWMAGADHAMKAYGPHPDAAERLNEEKAKTQSDDEASSTRPVTSAKSTKSE